MKKINIHIIFTLVIISFSISGCIYQHANLERKISIYDNKPFIHIKYDGHSMGWFLETAKKDDKIGAIFGILGYKKNIISIYDKRWMIYFQIVDKDYNPTMRRSIKLENKPTGFVSSSAKIFATKRGFLLIYLTEGKYYFTEYNLEGKKIHKKTALYADKNFTQNNLRVMNISYNNDIIYMLTREFNENQNNNAFNLIKYNVKTEKTSVNENFITLKTKSNERRDYAEIYHTKTDSMYIAWNSFKYPEDVKFYFAKCSAKDNKCVNYDTIFSLKTNNKTDLRIVEYDKELRILIRNIHYKKNIFWSQKIDKNGNLIGEMKEVERKNLWRFFSVEKYLAE